jgi:hypothetical protein
MVQISKPPVPTKLYRHFAVVTLALTAFLALFATGENAELNEAARQAQSPQSSTPRPAQTPRYGDPQLARRGANGSFGEEAKANGEFGQPSIGSGGDSRTIAPRNLPARNSENAGFTQAYLDSLSEEELAALLQAMRDGGIDDGERRQAMAVMETASRRRSGRPATAD